MIKMIHEHVELEDYGTNAGLGGFLLSASTVQQTKLACQVSLARQGIRVHAMVSMVLRGLNLQQESLLEKEFTVQTVLINSVTLS